MLKINTTGRTARLAAAGALALGLTAASATPAHAATTVRGTVTCGASTAGAVQGVWVSTNAGGNGWAAWSNQGFNGYTWTASYSKAIPSGATSVSVSVGCGGSPSRWQQTFTGTKRVSSGSGTATLDWFCDIRYGNYSCI